MDHVLGGHVLFLKVNLGDRSIFCLNSVLLCATDLDRFLGSLMNSLIKLIVDQLEDIVLVGVVRILLTHILLSTAS